MSSNKQKSFTETYASEILNSIVEGVFTVDKDLRITYFNEPAEKITGIGKEEALGQFCFEVLRSNVCERSCPIKECMKSPAGSVNMQVNLLSSEGKQIPVSINATVLKDKKGNVIGCVETFRDLSTIEALRKEISQNYTFEDIISKNHKILELFNILPNIAESESTVLIQGPSGSGKELFAKALHNLSFRKKGPFVAVNCGALPDTLLDSELFGYVKGAFTDAKKDKPGRFALAKGGTIFLDEIESISQATQIKLLRVLQEKEFQPLGADAPHKSDVRVLSASKNDLLKLVKSDKFRDDLYFRLNVIKIELPPLSERRDDIPLLINHFIEKFNHKMGKYITKVSRDVLEVLVNYNFAGNIRELENIIEHAFVMCANEEIQLEHLPPELQTNQAPAKQKHKVSHILKDSERQIILEALNEYHWNKIETAKKLGLHRSTLWRKMNQLGLTEILN